MRDLYFLSIMLNNGIKNHKLLEVASGDTNPSFSPTDGAGQIPTEYLKKVGEVAIAYDNDRAGQEMAQRVQSQLPNAMRKTPKAIDWNQDLVNSLDWFGKNRNNEIKHQHERDKGRGLSL